MAASLIAPMISPLIKPVVSSLINAITGKGQRGGLPLLALPLMMKVLGEDSEEQKKDIITWIDFLVPLHFNQYRDY